MENFTEGEKSNKYSIFEQIFYLLALIIISILGIAIVFPLFLLSKVLNFTKKSSEHGQNRQENQKHDYETQDKT